MCIKKISKFVICVIYSHVIIGWYLCAIFVKYVCDICVNVWYMCNVWVVYVVCMYAWSYLWNIYNKWLFKYIQLALNSKQNQK